MDPGRSGTFPDRLILFVSDSAYRHSSFRPVLFQFDAGQLGFHSGITEHLIPLRGEFRRESSAGIPCQPISSGKS